MSKDTQFLGRIDHGVTNQPTDGDRRRGDGYSGVGLGSYFYCAGCADRFDCLSAAQARRRALTCHKGYGPEAGEIGRDLDRAGYVARKIADIGRECGQKRADGPDDLRGSASTAKGNTDRAWGDDRETGAGAFSGGEEGTCPNRDPGERSEGAEGKDVGTSDGMPGPIRAEAGLSETTNAGNGSSRKSEDGSSETGSCVETEKEIIEEGKRLLHYLHHLATVL